MPQHIIPNIVQQEAARLGFNSVKYSGQVDGSEAYSVGIVDDDGTPTPIGLPTYILLKEGKVSMVCGLEGLYLDSRL